MKAATILIGAAVVSLVIFLAVWLTHPPPIEGPAGAAPCVAARENVAEARAAEQHWTDFKAGKRTDLIDRHALERIRFCLHSITNNEPEFAAAQQLLRSLKAASDSITPPLLRPKG